MRTRYIVTCELSDDDRRSVFTATGPMAERVMSSATLHLLLEHAEDRILMIDLGLVEGRAENCVSATGQRDLAPERTVIEGRRSEML